jgi:P27 family predicted phage terminase small subunit
VKPPNNLSAEGKRLFTRLFSDFVFEDAGALLLLATVCESHDRMRRAQKLIAKHGELITDRWGQLRPNPACVVERDSRAAMLTALKALNLDLAPPGASGRPGVPT